MCSGSAQIAKLHDTNQRQGNNKPNRETTYNYVMYVYSTLSCLYAGLVRTRLHGLFFLFVFPHFCIHLSVHINYFFSESFFCCCFFFRYVIQSLPAKSKTICFFFQIGEHGHSQRKKKTNVEILKLVEVFQLLRVCFLRYCLFLDFPLFVRWS